MGLVKTYVLKVYERDSSMARLLAHLLVESSENYIYIMDSMVEALIDIRYTCVDPVHNSLQTKGSFGGYYNKQSNYISLTTSSRFSDGSVFLDLPGLEGNRIGTFMLNKIVAWAKQWPEADVKKIYLLNDQAYRGNKSRRNTLYEQFGIRFQYDDVQHRAGVSFPMCASDLSLVDSWKENIVEGVLTDFIKETLRNRKHLNYDLEYYQQLNGRLFADKLVAEKNPFYWALKAYFFKFFR